MFQVVMQPFVAIYVIIVCIDSFLKGQILEKRNKTTAFSTFISSEFLFSRHKINPLRLIVDYSFVGIRMTLLDNLLHFIYFTSQTLGLQNIFCLLKVAGIVLAPSRSDCHETMSVCFIIVSIRRYLFPTLLDHLWCRYLSSG